MANLIPSKLCYTLWQATGKGNKSTQPYSQCIIDAKLSFVLINSLFFKLVIKILKSDKQSPSIHIGISPNHKQTFQIIRFSFQDANSPCTTTPSLQTKSGRFCLMGGGSCLQNRGSDTKKCTYCSSH